MELKEGDAKKIIAYKAASEIPAFVALIKDLYRASRDYSRLAHEKTEGAAAYWSGRADSLERLLENMSDAQKVNLSRLIEKADAKK